MTPYQPHSETSLAAAEAIEPKRLTMQAACLDAIKAAKAYGLTDPELAQRTGFGDSARPRRIRLVELGLVVDSGRTRMSDRGRAATVWVIRTDSPADLFGEYK